MYFIPTPKQLELREGLSKLRPNTKIQLEASCNNEDLKAAQILQEDIRQLYSRYDFCLFVKSAFTKLALGLA